MEEKLLEMIESYDTISFDIFDTLVMRKTLIPHDIFFITEQKAKQKGIVAADFQENRIRAEKNLIARIPDIYELYEEVQRLMEISDADREKLLQLELETEHRYLVRRDSVCHLLRAMHKMGKRIFLVSDMYIPKEILLEWLRKMEIVEFEEAFLSCEYHRPKVNGLYEIYKDAAEGTRYLHIGDSEIYDGRYAKAAGIEPFLIDSAVSSMEKSVYFSVESFKTKIENRMVLGHLSAAFYNDVFRGQKTMKIRSLRDMVTCAIAPLISGLALWLIEQLLSGDYDGLLLAARDGYLLWRMFEKYEAIKGGKLPYYCYFYTSRVACAAATVEDQEDFCQVIRRPADVSLEACVKERLEIAAENAGTPEEFYQINKKRILSQSSKMRARYLRYVSDLGLRIEGHYAFFDFVSSGTCLSGLNRILGTEMTGLFCYRYQMGRQKRDSQKIESFLSEGLGKRFWKNYKVFETILTSSDGTFLRFNMDGQPVFASDKRSTTEKKLVEEQQEQVLAYWEQLLDSGVRVSPSRDLLVELTELLDEKNIAISDVEKNILYLYDSYEGGKIKVF